MKLFIKGRQLFVALILLGTGGDVRAVWEKYSPFSPSNPPPAFQHTKLTLVRHDSTSDTPAFLAFLKPGASEPCLRLNWTGPESRIIILQPRIGELFSAPIDGSPVCDAEACIADLNGDSITDFIIVTHSGGNGLAAQITTITFLLSATRSYIARAVFSFDATLSDLTDLNQDGRPEFVHCMFIDGDTGKDERRHNYWAYNLLGFAGTELVSANSTSTEFPKWVLYTYEANHDDSTQLNEMQRQRQWLLAWKDRINGPRQNLFPSIDQFAQEQGRTLTRVVR